WQRAEGIDIKTRQYRERTDRREPQRRQHRAEYNAARDTGGGQQQADLHAFPQERQRAENHIPVERVHCAKLSCATNPRIVVRFSMSRIAKVASSAMAT